MVWSDEYYKKQLSSKERIIYTSMLKSFGRCENNIIIPNAASSEEIESAIVALIKDHPEVFWVNYYSYTTVHSGVATAIRPQYFFSKDDLFFWFNELNSWKSRVRKQIPEGLSRLQKAWTLYDYLTRKVFYDHDDTPTALRQTALGAIDRHHAQAVCEGISKAYKLLCDELGIPCIVVFGDVYTHHQWVSHAWNLIETERGFSHVDATSQLRASKEHGRAIMDFLMNDKEMADKYRWDRHLVPVCA